MDQDILDILEEIQNRLRSNVQKARWTRPEGIHLTLKFLGDVSVEKVSEIKLILDDIAKHYTRFDLSLGNAGAFPRLSTPKVLYLGIQPSEDLFRLQGDLAKALERFAIKRETKPFRGHLTLARLQGDFWHQSLRQCFLDSSQIARDKSFRVNEISLYESNLQASGAVYSVLHKGKLLT